MVFSQLLVLRVSLASEHCPLSTLTRAEREGEESGGPPPYGLLVEFAGFTGLRAGEIAALRIGQVDSRAGAVFVSRSASVVKGVRIEGEPKSKAGRRTVFLNRALGDRLRAHLGERVLDREGYVFASEDGRPLNQGSFYSGYSSVQITLDRYSHIMPHMAAALAERMDAVYLSAEPAIVAATAVISPANGGVSDASEHERFVR